MPNDRAWIMQTARRAGGLYLAVMPFGFFAIIYVPSVLVMPGDAAATQILFPNIDATISQLTFVGELLLPLCLVFKGVNVERWERIALTDGARES